MWIRPGTCYFLVSPPSRFPGSWWKHCRLLNDRLHWGGTAFAVENEVPGTKSKTIKQCLLFWDISTTCMTTFTFGQWNNKMLPLPTEIMVKTAKISKINVSFKKWQTHFEIIVLYKELLSTVVVWMRFCRYFTLRARKYRFFWICASVWVIKYLIWYNTLCMKSSSHYSYLSIL